jgi:hypothetical protein
MLVDVHLNIDQTLKGLSGKILSNMKLLYNLSRYVLYQKTNRFLFSQVIIHRRRMLDKLFQSNTQENSTVRHNVSAF